MTLILTLKISSIIPIPSQLLLQPLISLPRQKAKPSPKRRGVVHRNKASSRKPLGHSEEPVNALLRKSMTPCRW